jgi:hypothetical protein
VKSRISYHEISYRSFYAQFFRNLRSGNLHQAWEPPTLKVQLKDASVPEEPWRASLNEENPPEEARAAKSSSARA